MERRPTSNATSISTSRTTKSTTMNQMALLSEAIGIDRKDLDNFFRFLAYRAWHNIYDALDEIARKNLIITVEKTHRVGKLVFNFRNYPHPVILSAEMNNRFRLEHKFLKILPITTATRKEEIIYYFEQALKAQEDLYKDPTQMNTREHSKFRRPSKEDVSSLIGLRNDGGYQKEASFDSSDYQRRTQVQSGLFNYYNR
nr:MAG TPA: hypothetical protein [Caudoviricetes sp.]